MEEEALGGTSEEGKRRSANANVVEGVVTIPLSPEAPIPLRIWDTTPIICTSIVVLIVSGGVGQQGRISGGGVGSYGDDRLR